MMMMSRRDVLAVAAGWMAGARASTTVMSGQTVTFRGSQAGEARVIDGIALRWCPPGRFVMGSPATEPGRRPDEDQVEVTLSRGFWMAAFETTQGDWMRVLGAFPDRLPSVEFGSGASVPMYWVNYTEARQFADRLTTRARQSGQLPSGWVFDLPTEAQWEYACRAGTTTIFAFGDTLAPQQANVSAVPFVGGRGMRPTGRAVAVGSFAANAWGLCDMHGNIFEWCLDWYHSELPGGVDPDLSAVPGVMNGDGSYSRCRRGGAWNDHADYCRSAMRLRYEPARRSDHIGFRVALVER